MLLRMPWLISRKRLLAAVICDCTLFSLLYTVRFYLRFGSFPGFSFSVFGLVTFWLLTSYVIGRYQGKASFHGIDLLKHLTLSGFALFLSFGVYLACRWVTSATMGVEESRSFLIPVLLVLMLFSSLGQMLLVRVKTYQHYHWFFLGTSDDLSLVQKHLAWRRLSASLSMLPDLNQLSDSLSFNSVAGLLVPDFNVLSLTRQDELLKLQHSGVLVLSLVTWCEYVLQRFPPELLSCVDLLRGEFSFARGTIQLRIKRLGDLLVSSSLLVFTSPILLLAAFLIRLQDGGPIFYSQLRSGLYGNPIRIWKLRTMRVNAERHGVQWVCKDDSRITPLGRLFRRTRVDELPQLLAVVQGHMSLIGPRPERPEFDRDLLLQMPHYRLRYLMRPGLSGWAQVNYPYGASVQDTANKLSYDLYYLRNFSFWLDLLILFKTIRLVFNAQGALPLSQEDRTL